MPNIQRTRVDDLIEGVPSEVVSLLRLVAKLAAQAGARVALVGGVVRDLALGLPLDRDLDLVVQGDVPAFAKQIAEATGGHVAASHAAFGTATIMLPSTTAASDIRLLDLAQARTESYARPGALPTVSPATIEDDLQRRDYSINTITLEIDCPALAAERPLEEATELLDPFGGLSDLRAGILRVLHPGSFRDDPTRILRGVRLAVRLGLRFDEATHELVRAELAAGGLTEISADRVRNELCLTLDEPRPEAVLRLAEHLSITNHLFPSLQFTPALAARMDAARHVAALPDTVETSLLALGLLTYDLLPGEREQLIIHYRLPREATRLLHDVIAVQQLRSVVGTPTLPDGNLDRLLQPFNDTVLTVVRIAEPGPVAEMIDRYLLELRPTATLLNGRDLLSLGVQPGPQMGTLLTDLRATQLDGRVHTQAEAEEWVKLKMEESRQGVGGRRQGTGDAS